MEASEQNPFDKEPRNPFNDPLGDAGASKNMLFIMLLLILAGVIALFLYTSKPDSSVQKTIGESGTNTTPAAEANRSDTLTSKPYALYAFDDGNQPAVWIFSINADGKTVLTISNPITKQIQHQGIFPYADCNPDKLYLRECLADDIGLYKSRLWLFNEKKSILLALNVHNGELIYDHEKFKEKFGALADGIFKLRAYGIDDIEFFNKQGQEISFSPFSETICLRESGRFREKETIPSLRFFVNDKPGQSNIYVTKLKLNNIHGRHYWDYSDCESFRGRTSFSSEIISQRKLPFTLINPIIAAQNGSEVIILHDREFGNNEVRYAEAFDANGNSLWKDSAEVFILINESQNFPEKYNPNYAGNTAVFFDMEDMSSIGIEFTTGRVLWKLKRSDIEKLVTANSL